MINLSSVAGTRAAWLSLLPAVLLTGAANAQDARGWYAGVGAGSSHVEVYRGSWLGYGGWEQGSGDTAMFAFGGYRLGDHLALDLTYLPERELEWWEPDAFVPGLSGYYDSQTVLSTSALQLSVVGILPFLDIWEAYLKGGLSWYDADGQQILTDYFSGEELRRSSSASDAGFNVGLGLGVKLTENWSVRLEYQFFSIDDALINVDSDGDTTIDSWIFGIDYRFGARGRR